VICWLSSHLLLFSEEQIFLKKKAVSCFWSNKLHSHKNFGFLMRWGSRICNAVGRVRKINIFGRILTQFTGLLRTNTVAAKRDLLTERTGLGKSVSVLLRKNGPWRGCHPDIYLCMMLGLFCPYCDLYRWVVREKFVSLRVVCEINIDR